MSAIALQLAAAFDRSPSNANVARELRCLVTALSDSPSDPPNILDDLRARRAARRIEGLLPAVRSNQP